MSKLSQNELDFYKELCENKRVWTVKDGRGFPAPKNEEGARSMPFWSTEERVMEVIRESPEYGSFEPHAIPLEDFLEKWLPGLEKDDILVGINWSGENATGYDIKPFLVKENIKK